MPTASSKQLGFINSLLTQRALPPQDMPRDLNVLTVGDASIFIDRLLSAPYKQSAVTQDAPLKPGIYKHDGQVYVVKPNREGSNLYAKRLVEINGQRATEAGTRVEIEFVYAPGVIRHIRASEQMGFEEAKTLTIRYGRCICCGRHLKAAESVEKGIGPVCRKLFAGIK